MAALLRVPPLLLSPSGLSFQSLEAPKSSSPVLSVRTRLASAPWLKLCPLPTKPLRFPTFLSFAAPGEATETEEAVETPTQEDSENKSTVEDSTDDANIVNEEEKVASVVMASLWSYKEALTNDDQSRVAEIEAFLQSIEDEKNSLANKVATLTEELMTERDRILRISADFDNFRKRTERERLSLMTNVQGEVVESLLPVLDNFERAKTQIKVETQGEEKINDSYQSIYKQFVDILISLGVEAVETIGSPFDPLLHEAIMSEDSTEYTEGIIIQEFRKGFKIGDRLLRPSMVKVSAGPGPAKSADGDATVAGEDSVEASQESGEVEVEVEENTDDDGHSE